MVLSEGLPSADAAPTWLRDVETALVTSPQLLLYGNVRDRYLLPTGNGGQRFGTVRDAVWWVLERVGYQALVAVDPVDGVQVVGGDAASLSGVSPASGRLSLAALGDVLEGVAGPPPQSRQRTGVLVEYAARLVRSSTGLDDSEHEFFSRCEKLVNRTVPRPWPDGAARYNPVIWVVRNEGELPAWLLSSCEGIRRIAVPVPEFDDRRRAAEVLAPGLSALTGLAGPAGGVHERRPVEDRFAEQTAGMSLRSMIEIVRLSRSGVGRLETVEDAVRCFRVGVVEDPWGKPALRERISTAHRRISGRVRGQEEAVRRSLDIVVRSVMGLSGAQASPASARPRGVLFFAGPTGVGKTELAKALTELIFGDERACIRFDMSEFSAEHNVDRLIGAPPGYIGHDSGGELTNALRERPFSLLLFDEIEKAHDRVLDKFLQILDDGRLTDGSGSTTYFSESVIVFTSNLGAQEAPTAAETSAGSRAEMRAELEHRISLAVRRHFVETLRRPELLNRLGDNIVVFNHIDEDSALQIFEGQFRRILQRVQGRTGVELTVAEDVRVALQDLATRDLSFGGRGIGSVLESVFVNPLARALFDLSGTRRGMVRVTGLECDGGVWSVRLDPVD